MQFDPRRIYEIPLSDIKADNNFNCRGVIDPTEVMELARDISLHGLDTPVVVQPWTIPGSPEIKFRLVAGYRRHMAHVLNKATTILCIVRADLSDADARILNLTENIQRTQLNIVQEARAIEHLKDLELTQESIAKKIGKSRGWVQDRVYLLELPDDIQNEAAAGVIGTKEIRIIWSLPSTQQQYEYIKKLKDNKLLQTKKAPSYDKVKTKNEMRLRLQTEIEELQDIIRETLGNSLATRVLGWTIGHVSDLEIHQAIASEARDRGRFYGIPEGLSGRVKVTKSRDDAPILGTPQTSKTGLPWKDGQVGDILEDDSVPEEQDTVDAE